MQQQFDVIVASFTAFWTQLAGFVPQLIAALVLLFVGWLFANLVRTGVMKLLDVLKFDTLAEKTGIEAFLKQGQLDISLSRILAKLAYWIVIFVIVVLVSNILGLHMVADLFNKVVLYIPNIIVAILVLVFGVLVARFINRMVFAYLNNIGVQGALTISANASEIGDNTSEHAVRLSGPGGPVALNVAFLAQGLDAIATATVAIAYNSPQQVVVLRGVGDETYTHVAMPMTLA